MTYQTPGGLQGLPRGGAVTKFGYDGTLPLTAARRALLIASRQAAVSKVIDR